MVSLTLSARQSYLPNTFQQRKLWKIEALRSSEDLQSAKEAWHKVFIDHDPYRVAFTEQISQHTVFYPTTPCGLTEPQYQAVIQAAKNSGDSGFVLLANDWDKPVGGRHKAWWCAFPSYKQYQKLLTVPCEHALYSIHGHWGVLTSDARHALVGGDPLFIQAIQRTYPMWQKDLRALRSTWKGQLDSAWVHRISPINRTPVTESE